MFVGVYAYLFPTKLGINGTKHRHEFFKIFLLYSDNEFSFFPCLYLKKEIYGGL